MAKFYSVTLREVALAQQLINRWDYLVTDGEGSATSLELITLMGFIPTGSPARFDADTLAGKLQDLCSNQLSFIEVEAKELYTPTDFYVAAFSPAQPGTLSQEILSITDAYGFFSNRVRTDIRRGYKRFGGVPSGAYSGSSEFDPEVVADMTVLAELMSNTLIGSTASYIPAVFHFDKYTTPRGRTAYRKYPTATEQAAHVASPMSWTAYNTVRTQTSRQFNRGS